MGRKYQQLSLENRCEIARLQADGCSIRQIAAALDRAPSTISREVKRNRGRHIGYKPSYAQEQTQARRWAGSRLEREPELRRWEQLFPQHHTVKIEGAGHYVQEDAADEIVQAIRDWARG